MGEGGGGVFGPAVKGLWSTADMEETLLVWDSTTSLISSSNWADPVLKL